MDIEQLRRAATDALEELKCCQDYVSDTANGYTWNESTADGEPVLRRFQKMAQEDLERMTPRIEALRAALNGEGE